VDGTVVWCKLNCPGSWNDGEISREFQEKLMNPAKTMLGTGVIADSAFPACNDMFGRIITPMKEGDLERASLECRPGLVAMSSAITSIRQAAEWGVGSTSKCFRRLLMPLPYNPIIRGRRIENIYRLYNLRVRCIGISQIHTVFQS
jgi:DDE superfamily endonuclease